MNNAIRANGGMKHMEYRHKIAPYAFIAPFFIIFFAFSLFPIVFSVYVSLQEWTGFNPGTFVGLNNFKTLLRDPKFYKSLTNTLLLMVMIIPPQILIGLSIALMLNTRNLPFQKGFRLLNFLPYLVSSVALGMIFSILFDANFGSINLTLKTLGIKNPPNWIGKEWPARCMVAMITVWRFAGYTSVLFLAGITNINTELYEAAEIDGANGWQRARYIILPLLKPVTTFVIITTMIGCFQIFEEPFMIFKVMGKMVGGPNNAVLTGMWYFYDTAFGSTMRYGYGCSIAIGLLCCIAILTVIVNKIMKGKEDR